MLIEAPFPGVVPPVTTSTLRSIRIQTILKRIGNSLEEVFALDAVNNWQTSTEDSDIALQHATPFIRSVVITDKRTRKSRFSRRRGNSLHGSSTNMLGENSGSMCIQTMPVGGTMQLQNTKRNSETRMVQNPEE